MTRLIIWRHGQTEWNVDRRIQGHTDVPLDALGHRQARAAAAQLAAESPDAIVSSDLRRAADTAAALAAVTGLPVRLDQRLRERDFGMWQGLTGEQASAKHPEAYARWRRGESVAEAGVEEVDAIITRATAAFTDAATLGDTVVVVTHGGTTMHGVMALLGWPGGRSYPIGGLGNCHWAELQHADGRGWTLRAYNVGVTLPHPPQADQAAEVPESLGGTNDAASATR